MLTPEISRNMSELRALVDGLTRPASDNGQVVKTASELLKGEEGFLNGSMWRGNTAGYCLHATPIWHAYHLSFYGS